MPICVISTVGQSILRNADKATEQDVKAFTQLIDVDLKAIANSPHEFQGQNIYNSIMAVLRANMTHDSYIHRASAELNSLSRIMQNHRVDANTQLHFLVSETPDGVLAGRIVADFCREYFGAQALVKVHVIEGLQVKDAKKFRLMGLNNVIHTIYRTLNQADAGTYLRVLNPTGGFKAVIPYMTIIGMLEQNVQMHYIYEQSDEVITLGNLPLRLNLEELGDVEAVLYELDAQEVCDEATLKSLLGLRNQSITEHPAWSLFDMTELDDQVFFELSGLGKIVLERFKAKQKKIKIFLSEQAHRALNSRNTKNPAAYRRYIEYLTIEGWLVPPRRHHYDNPAGAIAVKPGGVNERLWVFQIPDGILVAELTHHRPDQSYEIVPQKREDYQPKYLWTGE